MTHNGTAIANRQSLANNQIVLRFAASGTSAVVDLAAMVTSAARHQATVL
jgi:hypothetical protein